MPAGGCQGAGLAGVFPLYSSGTQWNQQQSAAGDIFYEWELFGIRAAGVSYRNFKLRTAPAAADVSL